ncbi:hypothetical protein IIA79_05790 [bacterium]|nr:hypothetical protein [bacterium]
MKRLCTSVLSGLAVLLLAACDYPEMGYYRLVGYNAEGDAVASHPFMVEEITDDTFMTVGFTVLLPHERGLIEVPLENVHDFTRRAWRFTLADTDSNAGDLDIEIVHSGERLSFIGAYRPNPSSVIYSLGGFIEPGADENSSDAQDTGHIVFNGDMPPLQEDYQQIARFEVQRISGEEFETILGALVSEAPRVSATKLAPLKPDDDLAGSS